MSKHLSWFLMCAGLWLGGISLQAQEYKGSHYYHQRLTLFESLPVQEGAIVFLGNSITDGGEWAELLPRSKRILNRGISGDVTAGILNRVEEVARHKPRKVFLLIGINDLNRGLTSSQVTKNILEIVQRLKASSPRTKVYVQSILPVNDAFRKFGGHTNKGEAILEINKALKAQANEQNYTFIDLFNHFTNTEGKLRADFTNDGLHLLGAAYQRWAELIKPYL